MKVRFPRPSPASTLLRRFDGPLTEQLVQEPGSFGLGKVPSKVTPDAVVSSVCGYCATGCSLKIHLREGEALNLSPHQAYPVNQGMACPKGWESLRVLDSPHRATRPLRRTAKGAFVPTSWDEALGEMVSRFQSIQERFGPDSLAFLSTGQMPTEEMAMLGAVAKFGLGIRHGDGNTRQCMATAVTAYKESFGFDAPPYTYADFEESDVIVLVGANLCIAHPILWQRVMQNRRHPAIVVIDPRRTETAMAATHHLAIRPKSDLVFYYGMARALIERGAIDSAFIAEHTTGFDDFAAFVRDFSFARMSEETGLSAESLNAFLDLLASGKRVSFWWTMGVNQSYEGTRTAQALINLALMTGNIGKPGTGANSLTGQCNAMGSRLFSNTTNLLGGRKFTDPAHRQEVSTATGIPLERIPTTESWAYDQILEAVENGVIKGLWIVATNPAHSWINQHRLERLREKLEFLVVQDMYADTETARIADLVLPAAAWGEKDGTFINSERRIGRIRKVKRAPGEALADFYIFKAVADYAGCGDLFKTWSSPEAVFRLLQRLSVGQPYDFSGIDDGYAEIERRGGVQWPCRPEHSEDEAKERRLFSDGRFFHADGKARFCFEAPARNPEPPCDAYPLWLITGRGSSSQWHTQTRTRNSDVLRKLYPSDCYIEIHPKDADRWQLQANEVIEVRSRRGSLRARVAIVRTVKPGCVFLPMHYPEVNRLTLSAFDPYSRQPNYKACAVTLAKR
jgi:assimilatory nitrate reductase catalytic subunit